LDAQTVLFIALAVAAVVLVVVLSIVLLSIRRNVDQVTQRLDESLRQFEMTAEDLRKTNADVREILSDVERGVTNVTHFTEGIRSLRGPVDVASKVFEHALSPAWSTQPRSSWLQGGDVSHSRSDRSKGGRK